MAGFMLVHCPVVVTGAYKSIALGIKCNVMMGSQFGATTNAGVGGANAMPDSMALQRQQQQALAMAQAAQGGNTFMPPANMPSAFQNGLQTQNGVSLSNPTQLFQQEAQRKQQEAMAQIAAANQRSGASAPPPSANPANNPNAKQQAGQAPTHKVTPEQYAQLEAQVAQRMGGAPSLSNYMAPVLTGTGLAFGAGALASQLFYDPSKGKLAAGWETDGKGTYFLGDQRFTKGPKGELVVDTAGDKNMVQKLAFWSKPGNKPDASVTVSQADGLTHYTFKSGEKAVKLASGEFQLLKGNTLQVLDSAGAVKAIVPNATTAMLGQAAEELPNLMPVLSQGDGKLVLAHTAELTEQLAGANVKYQAQWNYTANSNGLSRPTPQVLRPEGATLQTKEWVDLKPTEREAMTKNGHYYHPQPADWQGVKQSDAGLEAAGEPTKKGLRFFGLGKASLTHEYQDSYGRRYAYIDHKNGIKEQIHYAPDVDGELGPKLKSIQIDKQGNRHIQLHGAPGTEPVTLRFVKAQGSAPAYLEQAVEGKLHRYQLNTQGHVVALEVGEMLDKKGWKVPFSKPQQFTPSVRVEYQLSAAGERVAEQHYDLKLNAENKTVKTPTVQRVFGELDEAGKFVGLVDDAGKPLVHQLHPSQNGLVGVLAQDALELNMAKPQVGGGHVQAAGNLHVQVDPHALNVQKLQSQLANAADAPPSLNVNTLDDAAQKLNKVGAFGTMDDVVSKAHVAPSRLASAGKIGAFAAGAALLLGGGASLFHQQSETEKMNARVNNFLKENGVST
jgi:hypothetical protein